MRYRENKKLNWNKYNQVLYNHKFIELFIHTRY